MAFARSCPGALVAILLVGAGHAQAGVDFGGCTDEKRSPVETIVDEKLDVVAKLERENARFAIRVNPYSFFYSPETMMWLYNRQCAFIEIMGERAGRGNPSLKDHIRADCEAVRRMKPGRFELDSIRRTLEGGEMKDFETQLGPFRRIDLLRCEGN